MWKVIIEAILIFSNGLTKFERKIAGTDAFIKTSDRYDKPAFEPLSIWEQIIASAAPIAIFIENARK